MKGKAYPYGNDSRCKYCIAAVKRTMDKPEWAYKFMVWDTPSLWPGCGHVITWKQTQNDNAG